MQQRHILRYGEGNDVCAGESLGFRASTSLSMAEAALWLTLGPSTARLDISAAASGTSRTMEIAAISGGYGLDQPLGRQWCPAPSSWATT